MFVSPDGAVTGSVNWAELERLVAERDDETITEDGYAALGVLLAEHAAAVGAPVAEPEGEAEIEGYEEYTVLQLRAFLADRGLSTSGNKAELVDRLNEADASGFDEDEEE